MSEPDHWTGELPDDAVKVRRYDVGYGRMSFVDPDGGSSAPIVTLHPEGAPLQFFMAPDALNLSVQLEGAAITALREWDPELAKMPTPQELAARQEALRAEHDHRQRIILVGWLMVVVVGSTIIGVLGGNVWQGIQGTLWVPGLLWVAEVAATWSVNWRLGRKKTEQ